MEKTQQAAEKERTSEQASKLKNREATTGGGGFGRNRIRT